jgi:hypothetical protein
VVQLTDGALQSRSRFATSRTHAQSSMLVWQFAPLKPARQLHEYAPMPLVQVAPFWQGLPAHSSMSCSQLAPV